MAAFPLIPGVLYRVRGHGTECNILAPHGCDAILIGLSIFINLEE